MENFGIDIGSFKTVISSSSGNGSVVSDELSKRFISSVLELSQPLRKFGNHCGVPLTKNIHLRSRYFTNLDHSRCKNEIIKILNNCDCQQQNPPNESTSTLENTSINEIPANNSTDNQTITENLSMWTQDENSSSNESHLLHFITYLLRFTKTKNITLSVPFYYSLADRHKLSSLLNLLNISPYIVTDITAIALNYTLLHKETDQFCVLDFGHTKTTFGLFQKENNVLLPVHIEGIQVGALDFDLSLLDFIFKKYKIPKNKINLERLTLNIEKVKKSLNNLDEISFVLETNEDSFFILVTKEEYLEVIKEKFNLLADFCIKVKEFSQNKIVEIVGGNSLHFKVVELVNKCFASSYLMNLHESAAVGLALFGAVKKFGTKTNLEVRDVLLNDNILVFKEEGSILEEVELKRGSSFDDHLHKIDVKPGTNIQIELYTSQGKPDQEDNNATQGDNSSLKSSAGHPCPFIVFNISNSDALAFKLTNFGLFEIFHQKHTQITQKSYNFQNLLKNTLKCQEKEEEIIEIGKLRNNFEKELNLFKIENFNLSEEQIQLFEDLRMEIVYEPMSDSIKDENIKIEEFKQKLKFIYDQIEAIKKEKEEKIKNLIQMIENGIKSDVFVKGIYLLKGKLIRLKDEFKRLNVFELMDYNADFVVQDLKRDYERVLKDIHDEKTRKSNEAQLKEKQEQEKNGQNQEEKDREEGKEENNPNDEQKDKEVHYNEKIIEENDHKGEQVSNKD